MKKIFSILLVFGMCMLSLASPKNQDSSFEKVKSGPEVTMVMPTFDLDFSDMKLMPLDVFASEKVGTDFNAGQTCDGFSGIQNKPPIAFKKGIIG